jgi:hypothetical protein
MNTLSVGEATTLRTTLSVGDAVDMSSTLFVSDKVTMSNDLLVYGDISIDGSSKLYTNFIQTVDDSTDMTINLGTGHDGTLTINGNIDVLGSFNNIGVDVTTLKVEDKVINLATGSAIGDPQDVSGGQQYINVDGTLNHKSGITIEGIPSQYNSNHSTFTTTLGTDTVNIWEKSLLWNWNEGGDLNGGMQQGPMCTLSEVQSDYAYTANQLKNSYNIDN